MVNKKQLTQEQIDKAMNEIKNSSSIKIYKEKMSYIEKIVLNYLDESGKLQKEQAKI